ncbi:MULE transposase domain [Arabidopsis thaliana x Arabidopsis arenosa]|uniref:MULE transposase domain n=1 Tax=Arabidopsis thaliana x Arabidopsis arenosa TaxID=1240361 RepID=A0A8T2B1W4_9BRAS|nr:MULE transposase domain [Arabidopsis thaliana x Arabidopsis arenosa]
MKEEVAGYCLRKQEVRLMIFLAMVYEDFGFDRKVYKVKLSYKLHTMNFIVIPEDTPPVIVCNRRQLEGFIRQCKSETVGRLCVQIEEYETENHIFGPDVSPEKTESKKEQYYKSKAAGKQPIYTCSMDGEAYGDGEEQKSKDEDEGYWFDCCDDSDGASSGDEDYGKSYKFSDEETDDEDEDDEENLEVEQEVNAKEAEVKDEEDEEMVGYWKAHRTLKYAHELVRDSPETGYKDLPEYLYRIRRANPGTLTRLEVDELDRFKYVFISFGASIDGFTFMRKVIVVVGTFLKGKHLGTLLLAITQDGNFNIFPLAFAIVDSENDESWEWLFRQLRCVIPDDHGLAIISDRHKSIAKAIGTVYRQASRGIYTYHLHKNIKLRFRGSETFGLVKKAATTYRRKQAALMTTILTKGVEKALEEQGGLFLQRIMDGESIVGRTALSMDSSGWMDRSSPHKVVE